MERKFTNSQQAAFERMIAGKNLFLTGNAGTGKSFLIQRFSEWCQENDKSLVIAAPTGKAAINVGGSTLHRIFGMDINVKTKDPTKVTDVVKSSDIILIDEISMCRLDTFDYIMKMVQLENTRRSENIAVQKEKETKSSSKAIQVILVGDFFQLPPVLPKEEKVILKAYYKQDVGKAYAFQSELWHAFGFKMCNLEEVVRQKDKEFIEMLNKARVGDKSCLEYFNSKAQTKPIKNAPWVVDTNKKVLEKNMQELSKIKKPSKEYNAYIEGEIKFSEYPNDETIVLKKSARVMMLINDKDNKYVNGSLGTIEKLDNDTVEVRLDDTEEVVKVSMHRWTVEKYVVVEGKDKKKRTEKEEIGSFIQLPLKLAYAVTIHKSQGQTYDSMNLMPRTWDSGQLYVGLSRARSIEKLCLLRPITEQDLIVSKEVLKFMENPDEYRYFKKQDGDNCDSDKKESLKPKTKYVRVPEKYVDEVKAFIAELKKRDGIE